jgi:probable HAF family extracellular repeat protein
MLDLGTLGGTVGLAFMANNRGQVIGQSSMAETPGACSTGFAGTSGCHGFLWDRGVLADLGTFGGDFSVPNWINEAGEIVGVASNQDEQAVFGFVWKKGEMTNLGTLPGDCFSKAFALNSGGQVVGESISCDGNTARAVLWEPGGPALDLNALVNPGSGLLLTDPKIINDAGEIVLEGLLSNGDAHSVVLIPCGEGDEDCADAHEGASAAIQNNSAPAINSSTTPPQHRLPPGEMTAAWRAQMRRRFHFPALKEPGN